MKVIIQNIDDGIHEFDNQINIEEIDLPEKDFLKNPLKVKIYIDKFGNIYRLKISLLTKATYICDRCLEQYTKDFSEATEQIYQIGPGDLDHEEDVIVLNSNTTEIDISRTISDAIMMSQPIKKLCKENCKGLCINCGVNLNNKSCHCSENVIDPRLEKLKQLLK